MCFQNRSILEAHFLRGNFLRAQETNDNPNIWSGGLAFHVSFSKRAVQKRNIGWLKIAVGICKSTQLKQVFQKFTELQMYRDHVRGNLFQEKSFDFRPQKTVLLLAWKHPVQKRGARLYFRPNCPQVLRDPPTSFSQSIRHGFSWLQKLEN